MCHHGKENGSSHFSERAHPVLSPSVLFLLRPRSGHARCSEGLLWEPMCGRRGCSVALMGRLGAESRPRERGGNSQLEDVGHLYVCSTVDREISTQEKSRCDTLLYRTHCVRCKTRRGGGGWGKWLRGGDQAPDRSYADVYSLTTGSLLLSEKMKLDQSRQ